jgi:hypothetical protein
VIQEVAKVFIFNFLNTYLFIIIVFFESLKNIFNETSGLGFSTDI